MKLYGWERVGSSEEYREMIKAEYYRLKQARENESIVAGLEEVKLRLFLSLLDKPLGTSADQPSEPLEPETRHAGSAATSSP